MRTVAWLRAELAKFPDDCLCWAYEGEVTGVIITRSKDSNTGQGVIYCSEHDDESKETETLSGAEHE